MQLGVGVPGAQNVPSKSVATAGSGQWRPTFMSWSTNCTCSRSALGGSASEAPSEWHSDTGTQVITMMWHRDISHNHVTQDHKLLPWWDTGTQVVIMGWHRNTSHYQDVTQGHHDVTQEHKSISQCDTGTQVITMMWYRNTSHYHDMTKEHKTLSRCHTETQTLSWCVITSLMVEEGQRHKHCRQQPPQLPQRSCHFQL